MNKQTVIAGLVGAIAAQDPVPCDGPFVARIQEDIEDNGAVKAVLELITDTLDDVAANENTLYDTANGRADDQTTLMAPFKEALTTAQTNYTTQSAIVTAATSALTALDTPVADATAAKVAAEALVAAQQVDIDAQQLVVDKLQQAVTDHTTELASMLSLLTTATGEFDAATTAKSDAEAAKLALETERDADPGGQATLQTATAADLSTKSGDYDDAVSEETVSFGTYRPAKLAYDKAAKECAMIDLGCTFVESSVNYTCVGQTNDPILGLKTACDAARDGSITTTKNDEATTWEAAVTKVATKWSLKTSSNAENVVALANLATINSAITSIDGTLDAASDPVGALISTLSSKTSAKDTAQTNWDTVNGQLTQATTDLGRGNTLLATLTAERTPLDGDVVVAAYLEGIQLDEQTAQEEAKTAANANLTDLQGLVDLAQATVDRAQLTMDFYAGLLATALENKTAAEQDVTDHAAAIAALDASIAKGELDLAAAISNCKELGYEMAQEKLKDMMDEAALEDAAAATVAVAYAAKAAFATTGETNTLCAFPPRAKDAAQEPRPPCAEGFCCGAAQKFLKDGTKLTIETCQAETGVHTYTFYPPLPSGSPVEPTPETWRFQCISGAQKLVAAATAALAASYMMA